MWSTLVKSLGESHEDYAPTKIDVAILRENSRAAATAASKNRASLMRQMQEKRILKMLKDHGGELTVSEMNKTMKRSLEYLRELLNHLEFNGLVTHRLEEDSMSRRKYWRAIPLEVEGEVV